MKKGFPLPGKIFKAARREEQITLLDRRCGGHLEGTGQERYDFIFMDAAKGQYIHFLPEVLRLLAPGGMLVSDNVLQDGDIIESRLCGGTAKPDHSQPDAGVSVCTEASRRIWKQP